MARRYLLGAALLGCAAAIPAEFVQGSLQAVHETAPSAADSVHATSLLASKPAERSGGRRQKHVHERRTTTKRSS